MKLKNCPFCGSDEITLNRNYNHHTRTYFTWVECDMCGAKSKSKASPDDPADENWDNLACRKASVAWNTRAGCSDAE